MPLPMPTRCYAYAYDNAYDNVYDIVYAFAFAFAYAYAYAYASLGRIGDATVGDAKGGILLGHERRVEDLGDALVTLALLQHHSKVHG